MTQFTPRPLARVFVISPFAGADRVRIEANVAAARWLCRILLLDGYAPMAPHLVYPQMLNDEEAGERQLGIEAGHAWIDSCSTAIVYRFGGVYSAGMRQDVQRCRTRGVEVLELIESGMQTGQTPRFQPFVEPTT